MDTTPPFQSKQLIQSNARDSKVECSGVRGFQLLLVDDHKLFCDGLANLLRSWDKVAQIDIANDAAFFFEKLKDNGYDLILLDLLMPGISGLDILSELNKQKNEVKVLIISQNSNGKDILEAVRLGASGFIEKTARFSEVKTAIEYVISGNEYYAKEILRHIGYSTALAFENSSSQIEAANLSDRELAVLISVCKQLSVEESASMLHLSVSSVKKYRMSLLEKTKSKNNIGLLSFALKNNLISLEEI